MRGACRVTARAHRNGCATAQLALRYAHRKLLNGLCLRAGDEGVLTGYISPDTGARAYHFRNVHREIGERFRASSSDRPSTGRTDTPITALSGEN